jgi:hypothetical protein
MQRVQKGRGPFALHDKVVDWDGAVRLRRSTEHQDRHVPLKSLHLAGELGSHHSRHFVVNDCDVYGMSLKKLQPIPAILGCQDAISNGFK